MMHETEIQQNVPKEVLDADDPILAELADVLANRLVAGIPIDTADYAQIYPDLAHSIRKLVPTMQELIAVGRLSAPRRFLMAASQEGARK